MIAQGKNDSLRARAILRSLVPLEDLQGVLSLRFNVEMPGLRPQDQVVTIINIFILCGNIYIFPFCYQSKSDMPPGLMPSHKQSMALFLERVYGIEDRDLFFSLLEEAFLPDLRMATMLEKVSATRLTLLGLL